MRERLKAESEMMAGLTGGYVAYLASITVFAYFYPFISGVKEVIALLPVISDIRGDIMGSSVSRMVTSLHLGLSKPSAYSLMKSEAPSVLAAVITTSLLISLFVAGWYALVYAEILDVNTLVSVSFIASMIISLLALPGVAFATARLFRAGLDPGNIMPTISTVFVDLASIPSLALVYIALKLLDKPWATALLTLAFTTLAVAVTVAIMLEGGVQARIFRERLGVIALVIAGQSIAGVLLAGFEEELASGGLIHVTPAFVGVAGALSSIAGLKMALHVYMRGLRDLEKTALTAITDVMVVGVISAAPLAFIGYVTAGEGIQKTPLLALLVTLAIAMIASLLANTTVSYVVVRVSYSAGLTPENILLPIVTTTADITGIVILALLS